MTSWKRLFGKKTIKGNRKLDQKYDLSIQQSYEALGPNQKSPAPARPIKREKRKYAGNSELEF